MRESMMDADQATIRANKRNHIFTNTKTINNNTTKQFSAEVYRSDYLMV